MRTILNNTVLAGIAAALSVTRGASADVVISTAATANMACSSGVCAPTAAKAVLNVADLESLLAAGNVEVTTTGSGVQAKGIDVNAALSWSDSSVLALDANDSIVVNKSISVAGPGGLTFATGKNDGSLSFGRSGSAAFTELSSRLGINNVNYTLVKDIASLASAITSNPGGAYALAGNYDASQDGTYADAPVATTLTGSVEGLGNIISHLSIDHHKGGRAQPLIGLFADIGSGGVVAGVRLHGLDFKVSSGKWIRGDVGGLVGSNDGTLFDDETAGKIWTKVVEETGGLAGVNEGSIVSSSANVRVAGAGGGGLVAGNYGIISLSHADGAVNCGSGLVDNNEGNISESYATGTVTCGTSGMILGGLVGLSQVSGDINNSYATGSVTGGPDSEIGGFVGEDDTTIEDSYSTGVVTGGTGALVGGFSGTNGTFTDCYWDTTTSGTNQGTGLGNTTGLTGLTTEQFQSGLPAGFGSKVWRERANTDDGLPYLINNPPAK
jgi:hypothetical protein